MGIQRALLAGLLAWGASGCTSVPVYRQIQVSRPNMQFSDSLVYSYQSSLIAQVEPGSALSGGAQTAGCTACK